MTLKEDDLNKMRDAIEDLYYFEFVIGKLQKANYYNNTDKAHSQRIMYVDHPKCLWSRCFAIYEIANQPQNNMWITPNVCRVDVL